MSLKSLNILSYEPSKEELLINHIYWVLGNMGYDCEDKRDIVKIIEKNNLDVSELEFPGGSFEKFKQDALDGKYDYVSHSMTSEERKQLKKKWKAGKIYVHCPDEDWLKHMDSIED